MKPKRLWIRLAAALVLAGCVVLLGSTVGLPREETGREPASIVLKAPPFVGVASAQEEAQSVANFLEDEAGISAYYRASAPIVFTADFKIVFRTIEAETANYIIGSVAVENYPESEDVHVYVSTDGWMMAYYLKADPVGKIFDWKSYTGASIDTKLEKTLVRVASFAGVTYTSATFYDFRYPNANRLMLIAETESDGNSFTVDLPSSFTYYERSWGLYNHEGPSCWQLNGSCVSGSTSVSGGYTGQGYLTAA